MALRRHQQLLERQLEAEREERRLEREREKERHARDKEAMMAILQEIKENTNTESNTVRHQRKRRLHRDTRCSVSTKFIFSVIYSKV